MIDADPTIVNELIEHSRTSIAALKGDIGTKRGDALFDFILADIQEMRRLLFDPQSHNVFTTSCTCGGVKTGRGCVVRNRLGIGLDPRAVAASLDLRIRGCTPAGRQRSARKEPKARSLR